MNEIEKRLEDIEKSLLHFDWALGIAKNDYEFQKDYIFKRIRQLTKEKERLKQDALHTGK